MDLSRGVLDAGFSLLLSTVVQRENPSAPNGIYAICRFSGFKSELIGVTGSTM